MHVTWRVLPHRPLTQLSERVWRLEGMPMKRVMTIAKRADGGLAVHTCRTSPAVERARVSINVGPTGR